MLCKKLGPSGNGPGVRDHLQSSCLQCSEYYMKIQNFKLLRKCTAVRMLAEDFKAMVGKARYGDQEDSKLNSIWLGVGSPLAQN